MNKYHTTSSEVFFFVYISDMKLYIIYMIEIK
nr:MAG TPA: hypothetical protein [Caudoviricetes sp.]